MAGKGRGKLALIVFFVVIVNGAFLFWVGTSALNTRNHADTFKVSDFFGTMASKDLMNEELKTDQISFQGDGLKGEVITINEEGNISAKISISSAVNLTGRLDFNPDHYSVASFSFLKENHSETLNLDGGSIEFDTDGENEFFVILRTKSEDLSPLSFQLADATGIIYEKEVKTSK
ncbi:MAG: hypothetical protein K9J12_01695 [Melioribacteraceae bacterium]|nr:hypothetical protein [Melioribacteraceae bacterium]MCF8264564.1 hypothetical protein [Melioribacteraceae bacterium]MCF8413528.1 hypothetical protein [Melioribacteraceae bacterium]MCF8432762.1 hypothetical protein [Melioribacteraceae bacterium]